MVVSTIVQKETPECKGYGSIDGGRKEMIEQVMCSRPRIQLAVVVGAAVPPELDFAGRC